MKNIKIQKSYTHVLRQPSTLLFSKNVRSTPSTIHSDSPVMDFSNPFSRPGTPLIKPLCYYLFFFRKKLMKPLFACCLVIPHGLITPMYTPGLYGMVVEVGKDYTALKTC